MEIFGFILLALVVAWVFTPSKPRSRVPAKARVTETVKQPVKKSEKQPAKKPVKPHGGNNWGMADPSNQLRAISKMNFERMPLLNKSEYRVFIALEGIIAEMGQGFRVMAQTSLGELIRPVKHTETKWQDSKNAFASINSKRLDFAIVDKFGMLVLAVEYQGGGHYGSGAFMRDAVKREALRRAGVKMLEVETGMTPTELKQQVISAVNAKTAET